MLAIDDDPNVVYLLKENLADAGYRVVAASSGEDGLQKARELQPLRHHSRYRYAGHGRMAGTARA